MSVWVSAKVGKSAAKAVVALLLASSAAGCSSDVTRFGGIFNRSDNITTNSIPRRNITGLQGDMPIPRADIGNYAGGVASNQGLYRQPQPNYNTRAAALNQPFPSQPGYDNVTTNTLPSGARLASTPVSVQRSALPAPGAVTNARNVALAQPFPAAPGGQLGTLNGNQVKSGIAAGGAPVVTLRPGETISGLSRRYGVPEKDILRANGLSNGGQVRVGQQITIPTFGHEGNAAKNAALAAEIPAGKIPVPGKEPLKETAALPTTARGKQLAEATAKLPTGAGAKGQGGTYTVKPGDSLARIARETGSNIDDLKAANGLTAATIRVGQVLRLPGAAVADPSDNVKTATIPANKTAPVPAPGKATPAVAKVEAYKPPVAKQTVTEAAAKGGDQEAPDQTGIGKYRWPVRGAVIAGYGANVDGNRNDGINISVPSGTLIKAAENGVVIYAGNGLKELGNTVLVRHNDGTVTVYGNADTLNVTRGQKVQRGQTLAASGMSGSAKRPQVHFEVRKDATPVNPMTFLD